MNPTAEAISEKMLLLRDDQLAEVDQFIEFLQHGGATNMARTSAALSEPAFAAVWSNLEDDVYDAL